jgi:hypothetical protein
MSINFKIIATYQSKYFFINLIFIYKLNTNYPTTTKKYTWQNKAKKRYQNQNKRHY